MRHKHPHRVRIVGIDVEDVSLAQEVSEHQVVFPDVPFAANPADAIHQAQGRQLRDDQVLVPFSIEFH